MKLIVTIDVEEEGLFSGKYASNSASARNVQMLRKLDPIFREYDVHPSLMVAHQAIQDPANLDLLVELKQAWHAEIGAHLHHWNTPPLDPLPYRPPVPSELMPSPLLEAKLYTLLDTLGQAGLEPVSFRMGRFNLGPKMFAILEKSPIMVDSSVAPMRSEYGGPEHLSAPTDPYFPDSAEPCSPGSSHILEVPVTVIPLIPNSGTLFKRIARRYDAVKEKLWWTAKYMGSLSAQPMATGLRRLRAAILLHRARGGEVVTLFFHSSDLMPGCCPQHKTDRHVDAFLKKLAEYLRWLRMDLGAETLTLAELGHARGCGKNLSPHDAMAAQNE